MLTGLLATFRLLVAKIRVGECYGDLSTPISVIVSGVAARREEMNRTIPCLLVVLLATLLVGREMPVVQRVEDAIRASEPGWVCSHAVLNAPPPDVPSEKRLVASVWEHTSQNGKRESVHLYISQVDSRSDAETSLKSMREGKVAPGWKVEPYSIGDEAYLAKFRDGTRYEIHFRKNTIIVRVSSDSIRLAGRFAKCAEGQIQAD
jgi:hypothetical protein